MRTGRFITFEGGEGGGKSTQLQSLATRLREQGLEVVTTREPGGSAGAEAIRDLLVRGATDRWSSMTETLLMYAARRDHIERVVLPALSQGRWVLCDRFADSTRAYQGAAGGASPELIAVLEQHIVSDVWPDLTLVLDLPAEQGLARAASRAGSETRFESKGEAFHSRLRQAFLRIAEAEPGRCVVIDASPPLEAVAQQVWEAVESRLAPAGG